MSKLIRHVVIEDGNVVNVVEFDSIQNNKTFIPSETAQIGWGYSKGKFTAPPEVARSSEDLAVDIRLQRDVLLSLSDKTQMPDAELSDAKKAEWAAYRKALRHLPEQKDFPISVTWPECPK